MFILGTGPCQPVIRAHFTGEMNPAVQFFMTEPIHFKFLYGKCSFFNRGLSFTLDLLEDDIKWFEIKILCGKRHFQAGIEP